MNGRLFVCPTPIGNLEDVSLRLLRVLSEADLIAAEDTRRTRKLLTHHGVNTKLMSYHEHNERAQAPSLIGRLERGERVALVSDAGTPGIADPGYQLVLACIERRLAVEVIPGPTAVLPALILSGLPTAKWCFEGFLPRKAGEKKRRLQELAADDRTLVVFESPNRTAQTLAAVRSVFGDRRVALARELTKVHEEVLRGRISEVIQSLPEQLKGEVVLVVEGRVQERRDEGLVAATEFARKLTLEGAPKSRAAAEAAAMFKLPKRPIYEALLNGEKH